MRGLAACVRSQKIERNLLLAQQRHHLLRSSAVQPVIPPGANHDLRFARCS
jgi:hypothetical protein